MRRDGFVGMQWMLLSRVVLPIVIVGGAVVAVEWQLASGRYTRSATIGVYPAAGVDSPGADRAVRDVTAWLLRKAGEPLTPTRDISGASDANDGSDDATTQGDAAAEGDATTTVDDATAGDAADHSDAMRDGAASSRYDVTARVRLVGEGHRHVVLIHRSDDGKAGAEVVNDLAFRLVDAARARTRRAAEAAASARQAQLNAAQRSLAEAEARVDTLIARHAALDTATRWAMLRERIDAQQQVVALAPRLQRLRLRERALQRQLRKEPKEIKQTIDDFKAAAARFYAFKAEVRSELLAEQAKGAKANAQTVASLSKRLSELDAVIDALLRQQSRSVTEPNPAIETLTEQLTEISESVANVEAQIKAADVRAAAAEQALKEAEAHQSAYRVALRAAEMARLRVDRLSMQGVGLPGDGSDGSTDAALVRLEVIEAASPSTQPDAIDWRVLLVRGLMFGGAAAMLVLLVQFVASAGQAARSLAGGGGSVRRSPGKPSQTNESESSQGT